MRVLGIQQDISACTYYRMASPFGMMDKLGLAECQLTDRWEASMTEAGLEKVLASDIVVVHGPANEDWFEVIKVCRKAGKVIVCDYDDNPFNTSPMNPYYRIIGVEDHYVKWPSGEIDALWKDGENGFHIEKNIQRREAFKACFKKADLVTTTTDILKKELEKYNDNVAVLPNCMDLSLYERPEMQKKEVRIGYIASASHYEDLHLVKPFIKEILEKHDNTKFVYFGDYRFKGLFQDIPKEKIEFHFWVNHVAYPYKLNLLNLDIGLCPLINNYFNRNKSGIKYFENTLAGAAVIATNIPPYDQVIENGKTGLLVDDKGWVKAMEDLINHSELRNKLQSNAYEYIRENQNIETQAKKWAEAYEKVLKQEVTA